MISEQHLIAVADAYASATQLSPATVSAKVFSDSKRLAAIRSGCGITVRRFNDALQWFSDNWPTGAVWPEGVARPARQTSEAAE